jgi:lipopolysaccharide/colanic/teichoic acid biosynthesis glycosyltransferase
MDSNERTTRTTTTTGAARAMGPGFHGTIRRSDLEELGARSIRDVALGRRTTGAEPMMALTALPTGTAPRAVPTRAAGHRHTGGLAITTSVVAAEPAEPGEPGEPIERYIERGLDEAPFVLLPNRGRSYAFAKRAIDLVGALVLLAIAWPVMVALAVAIRADSPGPALFRQERVTRGGRVFRFYKFRTMYVDARDRFPDLYAYERGRIDRDVYYKVADDPRNTRVGRWLRRTTLDELPNLFNVLTGDLSLVGPRPELPELVRLYRPQELACFFTKAGLTGLAQVAGRSLLTVRERLTLDLRYVAHQTLLLDLRILARTVLVVLLGRGAL